MSSSSTITSRTRCLTISAPSPKERQHHHNNNKSAGRSRSSLVVAIIITTLSFLFLSGHMTTGYNPNTEIIKYLVPKPKEVTWDSTQTRMISFYSLNFALEVNGKHVSVTEYPIVSKALDRYSKWMFKLFNADGTASSGGGSGGNGGDNDEEFDFYNDNVIIQIKDETKLPLLNVFESDESYEISIKSRGIIIKSHTQFGFLRGLETFSQMIRRNPNSNFFFIPNSPIFIKDSPRFKYRGLMIDVSRNYIYTETILQIIELMSFDKLNVLHIHLSDAQSFPYQMYGKFSKLSEKASFSKDLVFTSNDIASIIEYAYYRGITIIPEFDMPGHAKSFAYAYSEIVSSCPERLSANINNFPFNIVEPLTYEVIEAILGQWQSKDTLTQKAPTLSPSVQLSTMHLGSDELVKTCWTENPIITDFFAATGNQTDYGKIETPNDMWAYFQARLASGANYQKISNLIFWEDLFLRMKSTVFTPDQSKSICQVWRDAKNLPECVNKGYRTILSAGYYLDMIKNEVGGSPVPTPPPYTFVDTWKSLYLVDPNDQFNVSETYDSSKIIGLEAAMWGENVHDEVIISTIFPRVSAFAERAWSPSTVKSLNDAMTRLVNHRCNIQIKRNFKTIPPLRPIYCKYQYIREDEEEENWTNSAVIVLFCAVGLLFALLIGAIIFSICMCKKYRSIKKAYKNDISFSEDKLSSYYLKQRDE